MTVSRDLFPELVRLCTNLIEYGRRVTCGAEYDPSLDFPVMCLLHLSRQCDHMHGILKMRAHPDGVLIARSMLEGYFLLLWAHQDHNRARAWRAFALVHDWRTALRRRAAGDPEPLKAAPDLVRRLNEEGERFLKPKRCLSELESWNDPFYNDWLCGKKIRDIAKEIDALPIYKGFYASVSGWHHWDIGSLAAVVERTDKGLVYRGANDRDVLAAYITGARVLRNVVEIASSQVSADAASDAPGVLRECDEWFGRNENSLQAIIATGG